jgi:5-methyltetrahydrofolate--homocysteine methyltransferase
VKGEEWQRLVSEDFLPRLERMWSENDYLQPRALLGYFEAAAVGNSVEVYDPSDPDKVLETFVFPRQPGHDRLCIADFYRPKESGERDIVAFQAVTAGSRVTEVMAELEADGEFAEQLFVHGMGVQTAEGMAEWLHWRIRTDLGIPVTQGRRWSWGYPACPEQSEHEKLFRLLDAGSIGLSLSGGFAVEPEQSTVAIVSHHPEAVYFGMKSGRLLPPEKTHDEVIRGTDRDPTLRSVAEPTEA